MSDGARPIPTPTGRLPRRTQSRFADVIEDVGTKTLRYLYDFGNGWEHTIKIERLTDLEPGALYPRLTAASGRCPPDDVGEPWGYAELLEAIHDPKHERYADLSDWIPENFDPSDADTASLAEEVTSLKVGCESPLQSAHDALDPRS
jgi:pRiA4b ORF-3-like protein